MTRGQNKQMYHILLHLDVKNICLMGLHNSYLNPARLNHELDEDRNGSAYFYSIDVLPIIQV